MIRVSILYPNTPDLHFDLDYYLTKHIPLAEGLLAPEGLVRIEVDRGIAVPNPEKPIPFAIIEHLWFNGFEEMQTAMGSHSPALMEDVPHFANVTPIVQINRVILKTIDKPVAVPVL